MSSAADCDARVGATIVVVQYHPHGHWEIMRPEHRGRITCETLDDARRIAYLSVAHTRSCELIVRDAYYRVIAHELIDGYRVTPINS